jgi:hypothetical protein
VESDPTFHFDSDSYPTYNFDADPNRATIGSQTVHGSILSLHASIVTVHGPPWRLLSLHVHSS